MLDTAEDGFLWRLIDTEGGQNTNVRKVIEAIRPYLRSPVREIVSPWRPISELTPVDNANWKLCRKIVRGEYDYEVCSTWEYAMEGNYNEWMPLTTKIEVQEDK